MEESTAPVIEVVQTITDVPKIPISGITFYGLSILNTYLGPGLTVAFVGSSGIGKSTLINALLSKNEQYSQEVRAYEGKGRHATTVRQLFVLPSGALVIHTPGTREVAVTVAGTGILYTFPDILERLTKCRFSDCHHEHVHIRYLNPRNWISNA